MYIKKMIIVNIVCSVLAIIRSQITTDARIKIVAGVGSGAILVKLQCFYICAPQPPPLFFIKYPHES